MKNKKEKEPRKKGCFQSLAENYNKIIFKMSIPYAVLVVIAMIFDMLRFGFRGEKFLSLFLILIPLLLRGFFKVMEFVATAHSLIIPKKNHADKYINLWQGAIAFMNILFMVFLYFIPVGLFFLGSNFFWE